MFVAIDIPELPDGVLGDHGNGIVRVEPGDWCKEVRSRLGSTQLLFIGTEEGCSCGFEVYGPMEPAELAVRNERRAVLRGVLRRLLASAPEVAVWVFWWDEWDDELVAAVECCVDEFPDGASCFDDDWGFKTPVAITVTA